MRKSSDILSLQRLSDIQGARSGQPLEKRVPVQEQSGVCSGHARTLEGFRAEELEETRNGVTVDRKVRPRCESRRPRTVRGQDEGTGSQKEQRGSHRGGRRETWRAASGSRGRGGGGGGAESREKDWAGPAPRPLTPLCALQVFGVHLNKWQLDRKLGCGCLFLYGVFLCFSIMTEFNVFTFVNLPMCGDH